MTVMHELISQITVFRPRQISPKIPPIVCLCGSTRFIDEFDSASLSLTLQGCIVLSVGSHREAARTYADGKDGAKPALDELHKRKIDICDAVYVLNVQGYIGESTRSEIDYAKSHSKQVFYLQTPLPEGKYV